ncbi:MAG: translocation/assembly module TamB domain-containing protein [Gammaproteobacteria bacterium]
MTRLLIFICITLPALLLVLLALLLGSRTGADWLLREVGARSGLYTLEAVESGDLLGPLVLRGLRYEDAQVRVEIDRLRFNWAPLALVARRVYITELRLDTVTVTRKDAAPSPPPATPGTPPISLPLALRLENIGAGQLILMAADGTAQTLTDLALAADWTGNRIRVQTARLSLPEYGTLDAQAEASLGGRGIRLHNLQLSAPFAVQASGWLGYREDSELELSWEAARWPLQGAALVSSARGSLQASGQPGAYRLHLQPSQLRAQGVDATLEAQGQGDAQSFQLERLGAALLGGNLELSGRIGWASGLDLDLRARASQLDPARLHVAWPGRITGSAELRGQWQAEPDLRFSAQLQESRLRGYPLRLQAQGQWRGETLRLETFKLASGTSELQLQGQALPRLALDASLQSPDLRQLYPGLQGRAELSARLRGSAQNPWVQTQGTAHNLGFGELRAQTLSLDVDAGLDRVSRIRLKATQLQLGLPLDSLELALDGRVKAHRLSLTARGPDGQLQAAAEGGWDLRRARWQGQIGQLDLQPARLAGWSLQQAAALDLAAARWRLAPLCLDGAGGSACVEAERSGTRSRVAFELGQLDFAYFDASLPPGWRLSGGISGRGELQYGARGLSTAEAALNIAPGRLRSNGEMELAFLAGQLGAQNTADGLRLFAELPLANGRVDFNARLAAGGAALDQRPLRGDLRMDMPQLEWLGAFSPELVNIHGRLDAALRLAGTLARPRVDGELNLAAERAQLRTPGITLAPLNLRLRGDGSERIALEALARSGGGELRLDGDVRLGTQTPDLRLQLTGENFQAANRPDIRAWISPQLQLVVREQRADLSGELSVPRAQITPRNIDTGVAPSRDQVIVRDDRVATPQGVIALHSDVRLRLGDEVHFRGFGLTTRFTGTLNAQTAPGRPASGRGEIRLVDGQYRAYGQDLRIETGRLLFTGGPLSDPAVEIRALRQPREDITVGVLVRGRLDAPEFSLFSTPAMPQERQLSWLVLGRGLEDGSSGDDRAMLTSAALSMGLSGSNFLAQRVRGGLRLDDITIGARPGEEADQARLTVGKYLSPDLYVSYGVGLFQPGHVFRLLYTIGRGFKLQTESGVESGGDLIYSIER